MKYILKEHLVFLFDMTHTRCGCDARYSANLHVDFYFFSFALGALKKYIHRTFAATKTTIIVYKKHLFRQYRWVIVFKIRPALLVMPCVWSTVSFVRIKISVCSSIRTIVAVPNSCDSSTRRLEFCKSASVSSSFFIPSSARCRWASPRALLLKPPLFETGLLVAPSVNTHLLVL